MVKQIIKSFEIAKQRNWDKIYYFYDIHETILYPDYNNTEPLKFYPCAKEALQLMTRHNLLCNILYTCSHPEEVERYQGFFRENDIVFESFINENPLVSTTKLGCFDKKPYMNALFDDKAGFDAEKDWLPIWQHFLILNTEKFIFSSLPTVNYKNFHDLLDDKPDSIEDNINIEEDK